MRAQLGFLSEAGVHERFFPLSLHLSPHRAPSGTAVGRHGPIRCQRQRRRLDLFSSITVVPTLASAFKLETFLICVFLSKDGERRTECRKVQRPPLPHRAPSGRGRPRPCRLCQHTNTSASQAATALVRERPRHQEGMMTDVPEQRR